MNSWIVAKFGGSSVKDGQAMLRCSQIIESNPEIKVTIISATHNTTNQLELVAKASESGDESILEKVINELVLKHDQIAKELFSSQATLDQLQVLYAELRDLSKFIFSLKKCDNKTMDQVYSLGERMSSLIFSDLLKLRIPERKIVFFDARKVIKTNSEFKSAEPQIDLIFEAVNKELGDILNDPKAIIVTQGFIGSDLLNQTTTLGREGSDYSAALLGEAIEAKLIQIWTDVEGIATSDPRIVSNTRYISKLSFDEATALAELGAKVLFKRTLLPAKRKNIPVFVGSSLNPKSIGTMIEMDSQSESKLKAVTILESNNDLILSFVGSHLGSDASLVEKLNAKLKSRNVISVYADMTNVSISFKVHDQNKNSVLEIGHQILLEL